MTNTDHAARCGSASDRNRSASTKAVRCYPKIQPLSACLAILLMACMASCYGCSSYRPPVSNLPKLGPGAAGSSSQIMVPTGDYEGLWEAIAEAVGQTFTIANEEPVRMYDNVLTEGYLETEPKIGASLLEPWHDDSVTYANRLEATYQTIRRRAVVRVTPESDQGFLVQVSVNCEMEDLPQPIRSTGGHAFLSGAVSTERILQNDQSRPESNGWFLYDHDRELEQQLLRQILYRFKNPPRLIRAAEPGVF